MTTAYKVLGQSNPSAITNTDVYTVPSGNSTVVSTVNICNLDSAAATFRIAVRPAGAAISNKHYISYDTAIPAYDSISITIGVTLSTTDVITVYANTATLSFNVFGSEIY